MRITLEQASEILNRTREEVLYIANNEKRLPIEFEMDNDMVRNEDGIVSFVEGNEEPQWHLQLEDVLAFKKQMDEGLAGQVEKILEGK